MRPEAGQQAPVADGRPRKASPVARPPRAQRALGIVISACLLVTVVSWLANRHGTSIFVFIVAVVLAGMFIRGISSPRSNGSMGPGMRKLLRSALFWRSDGMPAPQPGQGQEQDRADRSRADEHAGPPEYAPGVQGHPFFGHKGQQRGDGQRTEPRVPAVPAQAWHGSPLPEPPVFVRASTAGQAPWHLPVGVPPSGLSADGLRLGDLEVRAASMVGAGHRCQEPAVARQDAYALGRTKDGSSLVIAIADGVSQSKHSDIGARVAVSAATRELTSIAESGAFPAMDAESLSKLYRSIAGEIAGTGNSRGIAPADVCAILITAVIPAWTRADGTRPMWVSWLGDVSLWIGRDGKLHRSVGTDKTGLDRNALHAVLPFNPDKAEQLTVELGPYDRVALMTDGVSDSFESVDGTLDYFARQWSGPPPHPAAFLHSLCYDGPGQTDDRTAVVVWCNAVNPGNRQAAGERP